MNRYKVHLAAFEARGPKARDVLLKRHCRGWFIGDKQAKEVLSKDLKARYPDVVRERESLRELNEGQWTSKLDLLLKRYKRGTVAKGTVWKVEIARQLRKAATAKNPWIAEQLNMGHPSRVSNLISNRED